MKHPISKKYLRNLDYSIDSASGGGGSDPTPVLITVDQMQGTYTITGSTYANLLDAFKAKNVILKDDLALSTYTVKIVSIDGIADDNTYKLVYLTGTGVATININKDGSISY